MKISLKDLIVDPSAITTIYKSHITTIYDEYGLYEVEDYVEPIIAHQIPCDGEVYYVPVILEDEDGEYSRGLTCFSTLYQKAKAITYIINEDGRLTETLQSKLEETGKRCKILFLIQPEGFDKDLYEKSASMPDEVEWSQYYNEETLENICYVLEDVSRSPLDIDLDALKTEKILSGEFDDEDDLEFLGAEEPTFILHKVILPSLPSFGKYFYLPTEINFNEKQKRNGYALFDAEKQEVLDIHIFDKNNGKISAKFDDLGLEDCGIFKDEEQFDYKILLSNIL